MSTSKPDNVVGLDQLLRNRLRDRLRKHLPGAQPDSAKLAELSPAANVPEEFTRFDRHPAYEKLRVSETAARRLGIANPFFRLHDARAGATTRINGREYLNFSSYDYLAINGHPRVNRAVQEAVERYGTSTSASRLVAGERPIQRELEESLAEFYDAESCIVYVSGHATNVSTIGCLFGPKDLVLHDALVHNSVLEGIKLSGAHRRGFPHNDWNALDSLLRQIRVDYERVLIVIEGLYSMDGDIPELPQFIDIKRRHKAFLMVDEAHALGVLGKTGHGIAEHWGIPGKDVDIWMGTLSKTLVSCGGYICGSRPLVELLKYSSPGFVYSVGIPAGQAAAALEALHIVQDEPERVERLQANGRTFLQQAKLRGINTGYAQGYAIVPAITGSSLKATQLSNQLFERGINVQPIIHPAVEERAARLRFFVSSAHTQEQMVQVLDQIN